MEENLTLQEQMSDADQQSSSQASSSMPLAGARLTQKLHAEIASCLSDLRSLCSILTQRAQGKDPNLSLLFGLTCKHWLPFLLTIAPKKKKSDIFLLFFFNYPSSPVDTASRRLDESRGAAEEAGWSPTAPARCGGVTQSNPGPLRAGHGRELHHPITQCQQVMEDGGIKPASFLSCQERLVDLRAGFRFSWNEEGGKALMGLFSSRLSMWDLKPACSSEPFPTPPVSPAISVQGLTEINLPLILDPFCVLFFGQMTTYCLHWVIKQS